MQLVDSKLYGANVAAFGSSDIEATADGRWAAHLEQSYDDATEHRQLRVRGAGRRSARLERGNLVSWLKASSASERVLALLLAAFVVTASPALLATVRSTVSLSFQILLQAGHVGLIALQIFGR
jgi:hypothetical protein